MARTHSACPTCRKYDYCKECYFQALRQACVIIHRAKLELGGDDLTVENWIDKMMWHSSEIIRGE